MEQCLQVLKFGAYDISRDQVFAATKLSMAFVNLKPLAEGAGVSLWTESLLAVV